MPYFQCKTKEGDILRILIDTGSNKNYIQPRWIKNPTPNEKNFFADSVGGKIPITHNTNINLFGTDINHKFFLLPPLRSFSGILGNDSLKALKAVIHTSKNFMTIQDSTIVKLRQQPSQSVNSLEIRTSHLKTTLSDKLRKLCNKYPSLFAEPNEALTYTTTVKAEIKTINDNPIYSRYYPYPMAMKDWVDKQIKELLEQGIIRPSNSPYNSPIWIVPKKQDASNEKKYRMVVDYRKLNSVTVPDRYPIPEISEVLAQMRNQKFFTVLDLKSGFHQIPLKDADISKTAFSVTNGKYEFTRLPFGLKNAPAIFQRTLDNILRSLIGKCCYIYIDDIIIFGEDEKTHLQNIEKVFKTLEKANMKVQLDKCDFFKDEVEYLGFIVSSKGIKTNPKKVETIRDFPYPKTLKDLRSFLGMSGFYRRFIRDYAKLAKPLTALLRGEGGRMSKHLSAKIPISFNSEAKEAFNKIKDSLTSTEVMLQYPDYKKDFHLITDASNYALGAVLEQDKKPIIFLSRTLNKAEEHYAVNEKEMLAIVWALKSLRNYLYGSASIKIYTDHQPLTYALSNKNSNSKLKRWKAILEEYNYELKYKPGSSNVVADALSRPVQEAQVNSMTATQHSNKSSSQHLIPYTDAPLNVFKNQLIISENQNASYEFKIVFPTYHRHIIIAPQFNNEILIDVLKKHLNPTVINAIKTEDHILGKIQELYPLHFPLYKVRYTRKMVTDLTEEMDQENEILNEHNRAHRNAQENKIQLLERFYFPQMNSKITRIVKQCKICKVNKYDRHPNKPIIQSTPIPTFPGEIVHIDLYHTNKKVILTAIDKFSKFALAKIVKSKATQDIKLPLRDILMYFGIPKKIVIDNEKSLGSSPILHMLQNQYNIEIFKAPPYTSTVNGQVERWHSTLSEIIRCVKAEKIHDSFDELLNLSIFKYNYSVHSTTKKKPVEAFFNRIVTTDPSQLERERLQTIKKLTKKQEKDLQFHNKKRQALKVFDPGKIIYVKVNPRLGNKLSPRYQEEKVTKDKGNSVLTESGRIVHKSLIKS